MMGIYSDSPAILSVAAHSTETKERIDSQLRAAAAGMYLHPSPWGAHVVHALLSDPKLFTAWFVFLPSSVSASYPKITLRFRLAEIKAMSDRLRSVREKLYDVVANKLKTPGSWLHIKRSTGMYW